MIFAIGDANPRAPIGSSIHGRDRRFESGSLQRGVHCETDFCRQSLLSGGLPAEDVRNRTSVPVERPNAGSCGAGTGPFGF